MSWCGAEPTRLRPVKPHFHQECYKRRIFQNYGFTFDPSIASNDSDGKAVLKSRRRWRSASGSWTQNLTKASSARRNPANTINIEEMMAKKNTHTRWPIEKKSILHIEVPLGYQSHSFLHRKKMVSQGSLLTCLISTTMHLKLVNALAADPSMLSLYLPQTLWPWFGLQTMEELQVDRCRGKTR